MPAPSDTARRGSLLRTVLCSFPCCCWEQVQQLQLLPLPRPLVPVPAGMAAPAVPASKSDADRLQHQVRPLQQLTLALGLIALKLFALWQVGRGWTWLLRVTGKVLLRIVPLHSAGTSCTAVRTMQKFGDSAANTLTSHPPPGSLERSACQCSEGMRCGPCAPAPTCSRGYRGWKPA